MCEVGENGGNQGLMGLKEVATSAGSPEAS